jgi:hypothetical protein
MRRRLPWIGLAAAAAATIAAGAGAAGAVTGEPACRTNEVRQHNEAVFGHFATRGEAAKLMTAARKLGFQGIKIEDDGCGDFEVEIDGADKQADRSSFADEARKAGFPVTFEQTAPPMEYRQGQVVGIVASKKTVAEANALMRKLSLNGFLYIDLARSATRWLVVMPQVPVKHALPIAHEVATAGFRITFRPGVKP